ncbi:hypothetical protein TcasGA2_TC016162 [Tribolium castaneum]|uniref:Uncharacterized protein n=1 Tax=Tribolium castaneum TaxID=7070 RepID=D6WBH1_TRICA|nr:hypothetical protein TcasGA2_TC016162 [Tribolium castaneum]
MVPLLLVLDLEPTGLDNPIGPTGADHAMDMDSEDEAGEHGPPADNAHLTSGEPIEIILMLPFQSRSCGICLNAGKVPSITTPLVALVLVTPTIVLLLEATFLSLLSLGKKALYASWE